MTFNTKEKAIMNFTLALTYNADEVKVSLPIEEAIMIYYHTHDMLFGKGILVRECKAIHVRITNGILISIFEF